MVEFLKHGADINNLGNECDPLLFHMEYRNVFIKHRDLVVTPFIDCEIIDLLADYGIDLEAKANNRTFLELMISELDEELFYIES